MYSQVRVCQVTDGASTYPPQGAETRSWETHRISQGLAEIGCMVEVILLPRATGTYAYHTKSLGPLVTRNKYLNKSIFAMRVLGQLGKYVEEKGFDIVHFHSNVAAAAATVKLRASIPTIVTWGDPFLGGVTPPKNFADVLRLDRPRYFTQHMVSLYIASYTLHRMTAVISVSKTLKERIASVFGIPSSKVHVIPPEVDLNRFRPGMNSNILRRTWRLNSTTKVILCPARITPLKSQIDIVRALPLIKKRIRDLKLFLVGSITDVRYKGELVKKAAALSVSGDVIFTDSVSADSFPYYYNMADVIVLPSLGEGLPSSLIEAMSCGKASVVSDIPPNREVGKAGESKYFRPHATDELAEHVLSLLQDQELRDKMGRAGRETAQRYYDGKRIAEMTLKLYRKVAL